MGPLIFEPIYKEMIWGGDTLRTRYGRAIPSDHTGESWDISCRPEEMGIVRNGKSAGLSFIDCINTDRKGMLGTRLYTQKDFPLLVKLIDARDNLSVQVHPDDDYAQRAEGYIYGKNEMWYILDAPKDAYLIIGLAADVSRDLFRKALQEGNAEALLGKLYIKKGDVIHIPAGLLHAITSGVLLAEIQQNSDITYRVYDYNRLGADGQPRPLHVDKALDVIDFAGKIHKGTVTGLPIHKNGVTTTYYIANRYFAFEKYEIAEQCETYTNGAQFELYTCVDGTCAFLSAGETVSLHCGDSVFIPAALGAYTIRGGCTLLKSYVPDIQNDFLTPLTAYGYDEATIRKNVAILQTPGA